MSSCKYCHIGSRSFAAKQLGLFYHRFPISRKPYHVHRLKLWLEFCELPPELADDPKHCFSWYLCNKHFKDSDYMSGSGRRLSYDAIPSVKCSHLPLESVDSSKDGIRELTKSPVYQVSTSELTGTSRSLAYNLHTVNESDFNDDGAESETSKPEFVEASEESSADNDDYNVDRNDDEDDNDYNVDRNDDEDDNDYNVDEYGDENDNNEYDDENDNNEYDDENGNDQCDNENYNKDFYVVENDCNNLSSVLKKAKPETCRVCGYRERSLIPIFEDVTMMNSYNVPLSKLLETYLPVQIQEEDEFPLHICGNCYNTLSQWHKLYITCLATDKAFKDILAQDEKQVEKDRVPDNCRAQVKADDLHRREHNYVQDLSINDPIYEPLTQENNGSFWSKKCADADGDKEPLENVSARTLNTFNCVSNLYMCKYCTEPFTNKRDLSIHYKTCGKEPTVCHVCGKVFEHRNNFDKHIVRVHNGNKIKIICDKCGKSVQYHSYKQHLKNMHSQAQSQSHYCDLCCKVFKSKVMYYFHVQKHEMGKMKSTFKIEPVSQDGRMVYVCPVCNKVFHSKPSLITHLIEQRPLKCPSCQVKLKNEKQFVLHLCKKFICQYCGKVFSKRLRWKEHQMIHTGEKPYKCKYCDAHFRKLHQKTMHHRTHLAASYECTLCPKRFKHASLLRKHIAGHEGAGYVCTICNKKLRKRSSLREHTKKHFLKEAK